MIAASGIEDVRDVLDHYNQEIDPIEAFLFRQQKLLVRFRKAFAVVIQIFLFLQFRKWKNKNARKQHQPHL